MVFYRRVKRDLESMLRSWTTLKSSYVKLNAKGSAKTLRVSCSFELEILLFFISVKETDKNGLF